MTRVLLRLTVPVQICYFEVGRPQVYGRNNMRTSDTMNRHAATIMIFAITLSACTTVSRTASNPVEARWVGRSAGEFFAKYSPPISDSTEGSTTVYNWRGGYNRIKQQNGRSTSVSCSAKIIVSDNYIIRDITIVSDRPGATSSSYCTELLANGGV